MTLKAACVQLVFILFLPVILVAQQYVEITEFYAKVYIAPSATSQYIGLAQKNEKYLITGIVGSWYRIHFKTNIGWIYKDNIRVVEAPQNRQDAGQEQTTTRTPSTPPQVPEQQPATPPQQTQAAAEEQKKAETTRSAANNAPVSLSPPQSVQSQQSSGFLNGFGNTRGSRPVAQEAPSRSFFRPFRKEKEPPKKVVEQQPRARAPQGSWFTQQSFNHLPPAPDGSPGQDLQPKQKYFQVTIGPTPVLAYLSPDAPILGLARGGDLLPLVGEGNSWCKVMMGDSIGWIERNRGKVVETPSTFVIDQLQIILILVIIIVVIAFILSTIFLAKHLRRERKPKEEPVRRNVLIIAKIPKVIRYTLTDGTTTLEKCFAETGFALSIIRDLVTVKYNIDHTIPDVVMIDWHFDKSIHDKIVSIFAQRPSTSNSLFIFYNVPDPGGITPSPLLPNAHYLPISFTDRDIFKLVTPVIITSEKTKTIQKSVQSSALEGDLAGGNLLEVLQFIEIGNKSGCLMVETKQPFGIVYFVQGRIVYATASDGLAAREAVFAILNLKAGKFRFVLDRIPKTTNVNLSTLEVLMEWTKAVDEAHGH